MPSELDKRWKLWIPEPNTGCYLWLGYISGGAGDRKKHANNKRPMIHVGGHVGRVRWAAKVFCEEINGKCPDGKVASHTCHNHMCVNPEHVVFESQTDNMQRRPRDPRRDG